MLAGFSPFADHEANEQVTIYKNILRGNLKFPSSFKDANAKDLIKRFLTASPSARIGCLKGGATDVKRHKFFEKIDWEALYKKAIPPPIKPVIKSATDTSNFDEFTTDTRVQPYIETGEVWDADF
jgi:serine/threonine protein kinase